MDTPPPPNCPANIDPEEWAWFVDQLHCSLRTIKRKMDEACDLTTMLEAIDLIVAEARVTSVRRTRFVLTA